MRHRDKSFLLRPNHGSYCPQVIVNVAVQTVRVPHPTRKNAWLEKLALGGACRWRWSEKEIQRIEWVFFRETNQFWDWLIGQHKDRRSLWLIAHGVGRILTLLQFWDLLDNNIYSLGHDWEGKRGKKVDKEAQTRAGEYLLCTRDPPTIVQAKHGKHFLHAIDLRNYWNTDLDQIAAMVKLERLEMPVKLAPAHRWIEFLRREVDIQRQAIFQLFKWWDSNDMGVFRFTASGLAMAYFRHRHLRPPILIDDCQPAREISRAALYTGETRLWYAGKVVPPLVYGDRLARAPKGKPLRLRHGPVWVYDCNSLYPAVMRDNLFPRELVAWKEPADLDDLTQWMKNLCLVARVRIDSPERPYPLRIEKGLWFATGKFWTTLAGPELAEALKDGALTAVAAIAAYMPGRLFTSYVDALYPQKVAARRAGDKATESLCKMLLNGLAGKFGQREPEWEWDDNPGPGPLWGKVHRAVNGIPDPRAYRVISGYLQVEGDSEDALRSLPAVEAFVNAYGRVYMHTVRRNIGEEHILYQDTDSLHLTETGHERLCRLDLADEDELGKFRLDTIAETAEYRGPKDYTLDGVHTIAGRKLDALPHGAKKFIQEEIEELDSTLQRQPWGVITVAETVKTFGRYHPRGVLHANGSVSPARVEGGELVLTPKGREHDPARQPARKHR